MGKFENGQILGGNALNWKISEREREGGRGEAEEDNRGKLKSNHKRTKDEPRLNYELIKMFCPQARFGLHNEQGQRERERGVCCSNPLYFVLPFWLFAFAEHTNPLQKQIEYNFGLGE